MTAQRDYEIFEAGDVTLQSGTVFPAMKLAYKTYGALSAAKDNVILYPTSFSAQHYDTGVADPARRCARSRTLFSSSSRTCSATGLSFVTVELRPGASFPQVTYHDAIAVQHRLLAERFGIDEARAGLWLVDGRHAGLSLGGPLSRYGGTCRGGVRRRRCAPYNYVFLEGVKAALTADPAFRDGRFVDKPVAGFRAMGRVYAGWATSHGFYRDEVWREAGFNLSLEDYPPSAAGTLPLPGATPTI